MQERLQWRRSRDSNGRCLAIARGAHQVVAIMLWSGEDVVGVDVAVRRSEGILAASLEFQIGRRQICLTNTRHTLLIFLKAGS